MQLDISERSLDALHGEGPFAALGLNPVLIGALSALGYQEPTAIQREAIPALLAGHDVLGQAATGTGKTAAFALPLMHRLLADEKRGGVRALIVVPTRELAMQVAQTMQSYARDIAIRVLAIYGGQAMHLQTRALQRGVDVVVATPGRVADHLRRGTFSLDAVHTVILDEADEMLDMGFAEEIELLLGQLPAEHQTALFSATLPKRIIAIANRHLKDPRRIAIAAAVAVEGEAPRVRELAFVVQRRFKVPALVRVLDMEQPSSAILFCRTRGDVDELTNVLNGRGISAEAIHGGLSQEQRDRVLKRFRDGSSSMLIATDVAARGLDIDHVSHVINFDLPSSADTYVHRIGRTGRAGREGTALSFLQPAEQRALRIIEQQTKRKVTLGTIPTAKELRVKRLASLRDALDTTPSPASSEYMSIVDALVERHDPRELAAAALRLLDIARFGDAKDEPDVPTEQVVTFKDGAKGTPAIPRPLIQRTPQPHAEIPDGVKLYLNVGRRDGIRPGDIVGSIANLAGIEGRMIGAITLSDRFSLVEVPGAKATAIIEALRGALVRGKKISARRDRDVPSIPHASPQRPAEHVKNRRKVTVAAN